MKFKLLFILLAVFAMSCSDDDVQELTEITQDFTASESVDVSIGANDPLTYSLTRTIDASINNFDISSVEVVSVTAEITSVLIQNGATNLTEASIEIVGTNIALTLSDIDLSNTVGNVYEFNIPADALATLGSAIAASESIILNMTATVDNKPVDFTLELTFNLKATGNLIG